MDVARGQYVQGVIGEMLPRGSSGSAAMAQAFHASDITWPSGSKDEIPSSHSPFCMLTLDLSEFPLLRTERLDLRPIAQDDAHALYAMRSDPRVMRHIGRPMASTLQDAVELITRIEDNWKAGVGITWAMVPHGSTDLIGTIGFYRWKLEHHLSEVGYMLHPDHWGKGLMAEALARCVDSGFEHFGFHRIEAITEPANSASRRLLERSGFVHEATLKENYYWNGVFQDSCIYRRLVSA